MSITTILALTHVAALIGGFAIKWLHGLFSGGSGPASTLNSVMSGAQQMAGQVVSNMVHNGLAQIADGISQSLVNLHAKNVTPQAPAPTVNAPTAAK